MKLFRRTCLFLILLFLPLILLVASCRPVSDLSREDSPRVPPSYQVREEEAMLDDLDLSSLKKAIGVSIQYYRSRGAEETYCLRNRCYSSAEMIASLESFLRIMISDLPRRPSKRQFGRNSRSLRLMKILYLQVIMSRF